MSLKKLATLTVNAENNKLTLVDTTGEDNIASSTKYATGSTNPNRTKNNILTECIVTKEDGTTISFTDNELISTVTPNILAKGTLIPKNSFTKEFTLSGLGYGVETKKFPVGVVKIEYWSWYDLTGIVDNKCIVLNSTTLYGEQAEFDTIKNGFGDTKYIKIIKKNDSSVQVNKTISSITDAENIVLETALPSSFPLSAEVVVFAGYLTEVYVLTDGVFLDCFQPKITNINVVQTSCCKTCKSANVDNLTEMLVGYFGVQAQMESEEFDRANSNIKTLYKICQAEACKPCGG